jgi:hypothetical protein
MWWERSMQHPTRLGRPYRPSISMENPHGFRCAGIFLRSIWDEKRAGYAFPGAVLQMLKRCPLITLVPQVKPNFKLEINYNHPELAQLNSPGVPGPSY